MLELQALEQLVAEEVVVLVKALKDQALVVVSNKSTGGPVAGQWRARRDPRFLCLFAEEGAGSAFQD